MNQMFAVLKQNQLRSSLRMHGGLMSCVGLYIHRHQKPLQVVKEGQETPFKKKKQKMTMIPPTVTLILGLQSDI